MNPAENYILNTPEPFRQTLMELRSSLFHNVPDLEENYKWRLPFYTIGGRMFCYLNYRRTYIDLSFIHGVHIKNYTEYLIDGANRKQARSLQFTDIESIDYTVLEPIIREAAAWVRHRQK